jgi:monoamine oxidase
MFEFLDERGEVVTVRSARSLDLLLAKHVIVATTPFRATGDIRFEPASASPILQAMNRSGFAGGSNP